MENKPIYSEGCMIKYICYGRKYYSYAIIYKVTNKTYYVRDVYFKTKQCGNNKILDDINKFGFDVDIDNDEFSNRNHIVRIGKEICLIEDDNNLLEDFRNNILSDNGKYFQVMIKI